MEDSNRVKTLSKPQFPHKNLDYLTDYSLEGKPWDKNKAYNQDVAKIYASAYEFERYAERMNACAGVLCFDWGAEISTGLSILKLTKFHACHVRNCPVCQWRRVLAWHARFYEFLPGLVKDYPMARWLFLTLTIRNIPVIELGKTLTHMNESFKRLRDRKEFKPVFGCLKSTEVTRGKDGSAHPHFHILSMVDPSWFKRNYVRQERWVELWQESLRYNYAPGVHICTVKPKYSTEKVVDFDAMALQDAVTETLKYIVKPSDMINYPEWFLELTRQTKGRRAISAYGLLKEALKKEKILFEEKKESRKEEGDDLVFSWDKDKRRYKRDFNKE